MFNVKDLTASKLARIGVAWDEEFVGQCKTLLFDVSLQDTVTDEWKWHPKQGDGYTVYGMYQMLTRREMHNYDATSTGI